MAANKSMNLSDKPVANPMAVLRVEFDDWAVLFNPDTAAAMGLNPTGVEVWRQLDGQRTLEQIVDGLRARYSGVPTQAGDDLLTFVNYLAATGFVGLEWKQDH